MTIWILAALIAVLLGLGIFLTTNLFRLRLELERTRKAGAVDDQMRQTFQALAAEALKGSSDQFLQLAKTVMAKEQAETKSEIEKKVVAIDRLLEPLQKTLTDYQSHIREVERSRERAFTQIEQELKRVAEVGSTLNRETAALKNALKRPHVRGRWGEVQLRNCIELSGMSEYCDVTFQDQHETGEGRLIPDMTVRMPGGRLVIVDAKTPIEAFLNSLEANDDETRAQELARHGRHVKEHAKKLAGKAYAENLKGSADFTIMFLPNESFLYAALEAEPDLIEYSLDKKVLIATPPTLIGLLKVIRFGWNEEKLADNARKISEVGAELHKRVCDFLDAYVSVGKHLDRARAEFDKGLGRLERRVIPEARKLEQLGAKSAKELADTAEFTAITPSEPDPQSDSLLESPDQRTSAEREQSS